MLAATTGCGDGAFVCPATPCPPALTLNFRRETLEPFTRGHYLVITVEGQAAPDTCEFDLTDAGAAPNACGAELSFESDVEELRFSYFTTPDSLSVRLSLADTVLSGVIFLGIEYIATAPNGLGCGTCPYATFTIPSQ